MSWSRLGSDAARSHWDENGDTSVKGRGSEKTGWLGEKEDGSEEDGGGAKEKLEQQRYSW